MKMPEAAEFVTCDTVSECFDGVSDSLSSKLWTITGDNETAEADAMVHEAAGYSRSEIQTIRRAYELLS